MEVVGSITFDALEDETFVVIFHQIHDLVRGTCRILREIRDRAELVCFTPKQHVFIEGKRADTDERDKK